MYVPSRITVNLGLLVCPETIRSDNKKVNKARELGIPVIFGLEAYETLLETGEIIDYK